jgi:hypothetical protein
LLGELNLVAITLQATGGMLVRGTEQSYAGAQFGHELPWGIGLGFKPQILGVDAGGRWQWTLEFHGARALNRPPSPVCPRGTLFRMSASWPGPRCRSAEPWAHRRFARCWG